MNKFLEIVKTNKSKIVKGAVVIGGSTAGLIIGLGVLNDLNTSTTISDSDVDTTDTNDFVASPETD